MGMPIGAGEPSFGRFSFGLVQCLGLVFGFGVLV